jgi:hypothetical protein
MANSWGAPLALAHGTQVGITDLSHSKAYFSLLLFIRALSYTHILFDPQKVETWDSN